MKAIENIKKDIQNFVSFTVSTAKGYPELSSVDEQAKSYRAWVEAGVARMQKSGLFTDDELKDIASYAEDIIVKGASNAMATLRELKRDAYKF